MKRKFLKAMALVLSSTLLLITLASCGIQIPTGLQGTPGPAGADGKSAYELAVENGYKGTLTEWLASLVGEVGPAGKDGENGADGKDGENGTPGKDGENGADGKSAYELAVENGYKGTLTEWLASLVGEVGPAGKDGENGADGKDGANGADGKSAYELAVENGFEGTLPEWLDSLVGAGGLQGEVGQDGKSAYELAVENGFEGTLTEWLASLVGADGEKGEAGENGADGKSAYELAVENGYEGDVQTWLASLVGADGANGKSAYEIAVENGYTGTEQEWLASLVGAKGDDGLSAFEIYQKYHPNYTGTEEEWIESLKGADGEKGEQGVSVVNAYVNSELHLILVLSDGTEIDAGYVGVTVTEPEPEPAPDFTEPTIVASAVSVSAGTNDVEITVALKNNPGVISMMLSIAFDDDVLELTEMTYNSAIGGTTVPMRSDGYSPVVAYWAAGYTNVTGDWTFVTLTFDVSDDATAGTYDITVTYDPENVFDEEETNVGFDIVNGSITVS